jgi:hypothetical protein
MLFRDSDPEGPSDIMEFKSQILQKGKVMEGRTGQVMQVIPVLAAETNPELSTVSPQCSFCFSRSLWFQDGNWRAEV